MQTEEAEFLCPIIEAVEEGLIFLALLPNTGVAAPPAPIPPAPSFIVFLDNDNGVSYGPDYFPDARSILAAADRVALNSRDHCPAFYTAIPFGALHHHYCGVLIETSPLHEADWHQLIPPSASVCLRTRTPAKGQRLC